MNFEKKFSKSRNGRSFSSAHGGKFQPGWNIFAQRPGLCGGCNEIPVLSAPTTRKFKLETGF